MKQQKNSQFENLAFGPVTTNDMLCYRL